MAPMKVNNVRLVSVPATNSNATQVVGVFLIHGSAMAKSIVPREKMKDQNRDAETTLVAPTPFPAAVVNVLI